MATIVEQQRRFRASSPKIDPVLKMGFRRDVIAYCIEHGKYAKDFSKNRLQYLKDCSSVVTGFYNQKTQRRVQTFRNACHDRLCPICQRYVHLQKSAFLRYKFFDLRAKIEANLGYSLTDKQFWDRFKFVTISPYKSMELPYVREALQTLKNEAFRWMHLDRKNGSFHCPYWAVAGAWSTMEVTYDRKTGLYHPHLHILFYWPFPAPMWDRDDLVRMDNYFLKKTLQFQAGRIDKLIQDQGKKLDAVALQELQDQRMWLSQAIKGWNAAYKKAHPDVSYEDFCKSLGVQNTVSIDVQAVKSDPAYELSKYLTKTDDFLPLLGDEKAFKRSEYWDSWSECPSDECVEAMEPYIALALALKGAPQMGGYGCLKFNEAEWKAIIQNANSVESLSEDDDNVAFIIHDMDAYGYHERGFFLFWAWEGKYIKEYYSYLQQKRWKPMAPEPKFKVTFDYDLECFVLDPTVVETASKPKIQRNNRKQVARQFELFDATEF